MSEQLTLTKPDDWHLHVRDGEMLERVVPHSACRFGRAIIMPNLRPPITTTKLARLYRDRILDAVPSGMNFQPLMTLFLTDQLTPSEIAKAKESGVIHAVKWYPAGATTHAEHGVREIALCYRVLEAMEAHGLPLLVHAETTDPDIDVFDREAVFIDLHLTPVIRMFPGLRVVVEHVSTRHAVQFVLDASPRIGATITAHHLLLNRNAIFEGGFRPHHYCRPVLKREQDRLALVEVATNGCIKFFLGTDSAPHLRQDKESACGCAGIYTAHAAIELYAEVFEQSHALDRLEAFASFHGADFYGLPRNSEQITLVKQPWAIDTSIKVGNDSLIPYGAGEFVAWQIEELRNVDDPAF